MGSEAQSQIKAAPASAPPTQAGLFGRSPGPKSETAWSTEASRSQIPSAPRTGHNFAKVQVYAPAPAVKTKLTVGVPNDRYEQEADRMAERFLAMAAPPMGVSSASGDNGAGQAKSAAPAAAIQREEVPGEDEEQIQAKPELQRAGGLRASGGLESCLNGRAGTGAPLDTGVYGFMEPRFGYDFGRVRVHTDNEAAQMNRALNARAFTAGNDVFVGSRKYAPGSATGEHLLDGGLTHISRQAEDRRPSIQRKETREQGCDGKVGDSFKLLGSMPASPPMYSSALIVPHNQPDSLGKVYHIGDYLNDYMAIVDIPHTDGATVVVMHCETEETLEANPGTGPTQSPRAPQLERTIKVQNGTFGPGTVKTFNNCQQVEFVFEDGSKPPRTYSLETERKAGGPEMTSYVQGGVGTRYFPLDLEGYLGVHLQGEKCGTPKEATVPPPLPEDFESP